MGFRKRYKKRIHSAVQNIKEEIKDAGRSEVVQQVGTIALGLIPVVGPVIQHFAPGFLPATNEERKALKEYEEQMARQEAYDNPASVNLNTSMQTLPKMTDRTAMSVHTSAGKFTFAIAFLFFASAIVAVGFAAIRGKKPVTQANPIAA